MSNTPRTICWFSCGAASAIAAKKTLELYGAAENVVVVNCDTRPSEHEDNYRFCADVEKWIGTSIIYISNHKFYNVDDVFSHKSYMSGVHGAPCTEQLKKVPRYRFAAPDDTHVFGFCKGEERRAANFRDRNKDMYLRFTLIDLGISKRDCIELLKAGGIEIPMMYKLGFQNNNCPGCVKASSPWYWDRIRTLFPDVFSRRCEQSRRVGCRLVEISHHKRIFLDELPPGPFKQRRRKEDLSCGPECGVQYPHHTK